MSCPQHNGDLILAAETAGNINTNPADHSRLWIDGNKGEVLIGEGRGHAGALLTVSGDASISGELKVGDGTNGSLGVFGNGHDKATLQITNAGSSNARLLLNSDHGNWSVCNSDTVGDALEFRDESASSTRMIIDSAGNVGIGTTNPQGAKLHVNGSAIVSGTLFVKNDQIWEDANSKDVIAKLHDNNDDGIFDIYQNNIVVNRIH